MLKYDQIAYMAFYFGWGRIRERIFIGGGSVGLIAGGLFPLTRSVSYIYYFFSIYKIIIIDSLSLFSIFHFKTKIFKF